MSSNHSKAYLLAKEFFEEEWGDEPIKVHSACVVDCCHNMIRDTDLNPIVFDIAGWLHDIGRKDDKDTHHELGLKYLEKFLTKYPEFKPLQTEISDCILNHRRSQIPTTMYGRIIQVADKLSKHHKDWLAYANK